MAKQRFLRHASIRTKMVLISAVVTGLVLVLACGIFHRERRASDEQALLSRVEGLADVLAHQGAEALAFFDKQAGENLLAGLQPDRSIVVAAIYAADGSPFAVVRPSGIMQPDELPPRAPAPGVTDGPDRVVVNRAIQRDGERLGTLTMRVARTAGQTFLRSFWGLPGVLLLACCVLAAWLAALAQRSVSRPIVHLTDRVQQIAQSGDLSLRVQVDGGDETGRLAGAVNHMLSSLHGRQLELTSARRQAEQATMAKGQFLANMSHDIRTPLNGVLGMLGLLRDEALSCTQRDYVETAHSSGESLLGVINNILDFTRAESGELELEEVDFRVRQVVEEVAEMQAESADAAHLELASMVHDGVPERVRGDAGRVRQVLVNLVENAIHFTAAGEVVIHVRAEPTDSQGTVLRFEVQDTGSGIDPENIDRMFECFEMGDPSLTRRLGGSGLGLAINKYLSRLMGGDVGAESRRGKGSTFWFTARFGEARDEERSPPAKEDSTPILQGRHVLVVDDNATNRFILRHQLETFGAQVEEAEGGVVALERLREGRERGVPYDAALIDMLMPGMDGIELARAIRRDGGLEHLPLVMLTSLVVPSQAQEAREAGVAVHLSKPVKQSQLVASLCRALHGPGEDEADTGGSPADAGRRHRVLVVDDNAVNQKVAAKLLERFGHAVDTVGNGMEAVAAVAAIPYSLVLMDCQMPEMDGFEATGLIRRRESGDAHLPIIAMTALTMDGDRKRTLAAGMDDYLSKPVQPEELQEVLVRWLDRAPAAPTSAI